MKNQYDPKNYWEMSKPFDTKEEAQEAIDKFLADVETSRKEYKIQDVHLIVYVSAIDGEVMSDAHYGDSMRSIPMLETDLMFLKRKLEEGEK